MITRKRAYEILFEIKAMFETTIQNMPSTLHALQSMSKGKASSSTTELIDIFTGQKIRAIMIFAQELEPLSTTDMKLQAEITELASKCTDAISEFRAKTLNK